VRSALLRSVFAASCAVSPIAHAQNTLAMMGTVEAFDAGSITVKGETGAIETIKLAPNLVILQNKPATLNDIKANDFIASAAVRKEDGKLYSTELRIFPDIMRGVGEGQRPDERSAQPDDDQRNRDGHGDRRAAATRSR
jgi:hypothetical protein